MEAPPLTAAEVAHREHDPSDHERHDHEQDQDAQPVPASMVEPATVEVPSLGAAADRERDPEEEHAADGHEHPRGNVDAASGGCAADVRHDVGSESRVTLRVSTLLAEAAKEPSVLVPEISSDDDRRVTADTEPVQPREPNPLARTIVVLGIFMAAVVVAVIVGLVVWSPPALGDVPVSLKDYSIAMSSTLSAGSHTFGLTNDAKQAHEFVLFRTDLAADSLPVDANGEVIEDSPELETVADSGSDLEPARSARYGRSWIRVTTSPCATCRSTTSEGCSSTSR